jgi:hypothetical protein
MAHSRKSVVYIKGIGGKQQITKLLEEINSTVKPYPEIDLQEGLADVHEKFAWHRETPKGRMLQLIGATAVALLLALTLYAMILHDREILLAILGTARYIVLGLIGWGVGKVVLSRLLSRGSERNEENQDTG